MIALLHIIAILFVIGGVILILYTEKMNGAMRNLLSIKSVRLLAIIPLTFGIALIAGSFYSKQTFWLALILGLLAVIKGVYLVIGPLPQIKGLIKWWFNRASYRIFRLYGLVVFVLGIAMLSSLL